MENPLKQYVSAPLSLHPNLLTIPATTLEINDEGMAKFNEIYQYLKTEYPTRAGIRRTPSGGIALGKAFRPPCWDVRCTNSWVEILAMIDGEMYRINFKQALTVDNRGVVSGRQAYFAVREAMEAAGLDLETYAITNGAEVKMQIERPMIGLVKSAFRGVTFEHAYHIDRNSSYWSAIIEEMPEFRPVIEHIYEMRRSDAKYKGVLNSSVGYFQSMPIHGAKWANLAKIAINGNNAAVREIAGRLRAENHMVLAFNTDGIWYLPNPEDPEHTPYHDEKEGPGLGQWKHDHRDCKIRFKSDGAYEFVDAAGKYWPVVRGRTNLDRIKPRSEWSWGDIYAEEARVLEYRFVDGEGIVKK